MHCVLKTFLLLFDFFGCCFVLLNTIKTSFVFSDVTLNTLIELKFILYWIPMRCIDRRVGIIDFQTLVLSVDPSVSQMSTETLKYVSADGSRGNLKGP